MVKFCRYCGQPLGRPGARYCVSCGQEQTPLPTLVAPLPQRRPGPRLEIQLAGVAPREELLVLDKFTIGRAADNDLSLPVPYVSAHHACLDKVSAGFRLTDLDSTNGTFVNGTRIRAPHLLQEGDIIRLGDTRGNSVGLVYRARMAPATVSGPLAIGQLSLRGRPQLLIGRNPDADVPLDHPTVSWRHAQVRHGILHDLGSTNGTFVNGQRLRGKHPLQAGDKVQIGPFVFSFDPAGTMSQYSSAQDVRLDGIHLVRQVSRGKVILKDVSLSILPREFVALVGSSGAGKSTLLNALSGFVRAEGQVLLNGDDLYRNYPLYKAMLGYVPQDDIVHAGLPVDRALRYAARLRLPPDTRAREIEQRIDKVLDEVDLRPQKRQVIASLSGGQRKRVSIALEMLADPSLFFLDEPTSGLDPGLEKKMMYTLRKLADGGRTIVLVTHATANIDLCNHVAFMAHGHMPFFGPPAEAKRFFNQTHDFADIYTELEDEPEAAAWTQKFAASPVHVQYVAGRQQALPSAPAGGDPPPSAGTTLDPRAGLRQLFILTQRYTELVVRDKILLFILLAVMPLIGVLIDLIAKPEHLTRNPGEAQTMVFVLGLAATLLGIFAPAYEIVKERTIYARERMVNLYLWPYLLSKVIVLFGFALIQCMALLFVVAWRVKLPGDGVLLPAPFEMYGTLLLATLAGIMLGLWISSLVPNTNGVIYVVLLALFAQIIFAGVLFPLPSISKPLSYLTITRYSTEALGDTVNIPELQQRYPLLSPAPGTGGAGRADFEHAFDHLALRWFMLSLSAALFGGLTLVTQWRKDSAGSLLAVIQDVLGTRRP